MKKTYVSVALGSAFALSMAALPATAIAATTGMATLQPVAMMGSSAKNEGNCSQMMGKGQQEGNCSKGMNKMAPKASNNAKAKEAHCVSKAAIKAHDGKCGKKTMEKMHMSAMHS
ncbi:hypothetical protein H7F10_06600 [Acidithiobacillus sp. HP-6]|uniref:hypothetical protein n=1 Tax=unclassified Acidithiobacillus TaxID=2614800 RepID=UPI00187ACCC0|nr:MULTISPECIES: hypothetical protein [unclassified Acidithiobacillus]MBE7562624.1 hypothetical protein [Acidithiobacillus sp. HP-6]MBE7568123.1 hypothetical protein [Acidithiobacillus sp. HP-2]MDD5279917.1 hypothetical protein [Acidithiobacillus sp.]